MAIIFWVDEEENAAYPDIQKLKFLNHKVILKKSAGEALDWFLSERERMSHYAAFVLDVQLPVYDDQRFRAERETSGMFAGVRICQIVQSEFGNDLWRNIAPRVLLYTQLPNGHRTSAIEKFAHDSGIQFLRKTGTASVIERLTHMKLLLP